MTRRLSPSRTLASRASSPASPLPLLGVPGVPAFLALALRLSQMLGLTQRQLWGRGLSALVSGHCVVFSEAPWVLKSPSLNDSSAVGVADGFFPPSDLCQGAKRLGLALVLGTGVGPEESHPPQAWPSRSPGEGTQVPGLQRPVHPAPACDRASGCITHKLIPPFLTLGGQLH